MRFLGVVFFVIVLATGAPAFWREGFAMGAVGTFAPLLALTAGGGVISVLREPGYPKGLGILICLALFCGAQYWTWSAGWSIQIFGVGIAGLLENTIGAVAGFVFAFTEREAPTLAAMEDERVA